MDKLLLGVTDTHDHLASFFMAILSTRYDVELVDLNKETPDILLFGDDNFGSNNTKFSRNDCVKLFYTGENRRPENFDCDYAISFDHNFEPWHYRLPLYVIYMWALDYIHRTPYDYNYIFNPDVKDKTDFCSFVVSNPNCTERNEFFKKLHAIKHVDSAGKLYNNINAKIEGEMGKIDFLSTRKFNICFEPYSHPGYVTEKILHAFYAGTIPIYWGSETIANDFNPAAFINVHDFNSQEEAIAHIIKVDQDDELYASYVNAPKFLNGVPPSYIMLDNFLNWFDAIVYNKINKRC
jgi:hypothetical protein